MVSKMIFANLVNVEGFFIEYIVQFLCYRGC